MRHVLCLAFCCAFLTVSIAAGMAAPLKLVVLGDSLSAGYQLPPGKAFPAQLQDALQAAGHENVEVINAGVSGDTSSGGLARVDWSVPDDAQAVILELGANDMLRGINPKKTWDNLDAIVSRLQARGKAVLIAGMLASPSLGEAYGKAFDPIYKDLADKYDVMLYPFFLQGVAMKPDLNQADGMHPTAKGVSVIVENMLPTIEQFLERIAAK